MKKILLLTSVVLTLSIITIVTFNNMDNKENNIISNIDKNKQVINSNMITMMYETEPGSGEYAETKDTTWPESGYIFNENLSGCENGGELEYNSENNTVNLLSNSSDRCYVYFDKYDGVWIDNVSVTNVTGSSVTLDVSATSENGSITTYYYVLNDSEEYQESSSNIITINDLNKLTEYKISIYAIDSTNAKSNIYVISVSTTDESKPVINSVEVSNITDSGFRLTVNAKSDVEIKRYYYIIDDDNISGTSTNNFYVFSELEENFKYNINVFVEDINGVFSSKYYLSVTTENYLLLADYIKSTYTSQGANGLYYHTSSLANSAQDNSYRYAWANPNNYVCFGSDESTCPEDNSYRIIGVFGSEAKLIKTDFANSNLLGTNGTYTSNTYNTSSYGNYNGNYSMVNRYEWNASNTWSSSRLNTVNLNDNLLNSFSTTWSDKITNHTWYVEGNSTYNTLPATWYEYESTGRTYSAKIGLMYVSDYAFSASPSYWTTNMNSYDDAISNNWMYMGISEWTISPVSSGSNLVAFVSDLGGISYVGVFYNSSYAVRPCFYLTSSTQYVSGSGTESDPIRIVV